jgi:hypothetical protein
MGSFSIAHWLVMILWLVIFVIPGWRIATKAGYPGALSLLLFVPLVNIIAIWVFAFSKWPVERSNTSG